MHGDILDPYSRALVDTLKLSEFKKPQFKQEIKFEDDNLKTRISRGDKKLPKMTFDKEVTISGDMAVFMQFIEKEVAKYQEVFKIADYSDENKTKIFEWIDWVNQKARPITAKLFKTLVEEKLEKKD